jgi:hypothetical protein
MKNILLSNLFFFAILIVANAQTTTTTPSIDVKTQITTMTEQVKSIKKDIDDKKINDKDLSRDLQHQVEALSNEAENLADKIDDRLDDAKDDSLEKKIEKKLEAKIGGDKDKKEGSKSDEKAGDDSKNTKPKKEPRRTRMFFQVAYGLTDVQGKTQPENLTPAWRSYSNEWAIMLQTRIGGVGSPVGLRYGVDWMTNRLQTPNHQLVLAPNSEPEYLLNTQTASSSFTRIRYIALPLTLEFKLGKHGNLGLGGYAGVRISAKSIYNYVGTQTQEVKTEVEHPFGTSQYVYGVRASLGYRGLSIYGNYPLSNTFDKKYTDVKTPTVGVVWGF